MIRHVEKSGQKHDSRSAGPLRMAKTVKAYLSIAAINNGLFEPG